MKWPYYRNALAIVCIGHTIIVTFNLMSLYLENPFHTAAPPSSAEVMTCSEHHTIYIPGAGFSGFFYTLGRLNSMHINETLMDSPSYEYYCFSSGCLALTTHLMQMNVDSALQLAQSSRQQFISGNISMYNVVEKFVDGLLFENDETHLLNSNATRHHHHYLNQHLSRIHVITTSWNNTNLPSQSIRRPSSVEELKQMLIQTTWIPFVTGSSLFEGDYHNDGGFAIVFGLKGLKQTCDSNCYSLKLPWRLDLLGNFLNIFLSRESAVFFWEEGLKRGIY